MSCDSDGEFVNVDKWVSEDDAVDLARLACPFVRGRAVVQPPLCSQPLSCPG